MKRWIKECNVGWQYKKMKKKEFKSRIKKKIMIWQKNWLKTVE